MSETLLISTNAPTVQDLQILDKEKAVASN